MAKIPLHERIKKLEELGYEVDIRHDRKIKDWSYDVTIPEHKDGSLLGNMNITYDPRGGSTTATIVDNGVEYSETAICHESDNYNKQIGANIALGRACKKAGIKL